ncbi:hypothetical protein [Opitutus sp. ER46]|uniref:hypothetical protein n=1 Tax=Opitutus sp. ER46 TaxID=2161864 RepID=UPI000D2FDF0F|nr:hypothetical protein [Opitutus sp. ER46]PTX92336.1 hypothetical protein DB354_13430 [Opitutus sp. ER46]
MSAPNLAPAVSFFSVLTAEPLRPLHALVRAAGERFRPSQITLHAGPAAADEGCAATILRERGAGQCPTIVLGGLVPDALEQVFLLRRALLRSGDLYYVHYPRGGFCLATLCGQLDRLVSECVRAGQPPVILGVSFGAGIVLHWLRECRRLGREPLLAGLVLISPVACVDDLIAPGSAKPTTLLGRALKPYLGVTAPGDAIVAKSRALFVRMFEAGAQNQAALRRLMTAHELTHLRSAVNATIRSVTARGAVGRVEALQAMAPPPQYFSPAELPLTEAPAMILFAQCEDAVLDAAAPVRFALEQATAAYFPRGTTHQVRARVGLPPVQHASLVFHAFEFLPRLQAFYQCIRRRRTLPFAA